MWSTLDSKKKSDEVVHYDVGDCSMGKVIVGVVDVHRLCAVALGDSTAELVSWLKREHPHHKVVHRGQGVDKMLDKVIASIESGTALAVKIQQRGTPFQRRVWEAIRAIPPGTTQSYAQLAAQLGQPSAARAVARACGANKIAVIVPCHRVVATDGSMTGYRWGVATKQKLLDKEKQVVI